MPKSALGEFLPIEMTIGLQTFVKEHYQMCSFNLAIQKGMQHQQHNQKDFRFISELPSLKTSNSIDALKATFIKLKNH